MILDLFSGPRGWTEGARLLGLTGDVGLEWDLDACRTARAAGHAVICADVTAYPTAPFRGRVEGMTGSPPCGPWSESNRQDNDRSNANLVYEPIRWIDDLDPPWVALEQVPKVLPVWEEHALYLCGRGYSVWTGELVASDYGVPQLRRRVFLLASKERRVGPPAPTHGSDEPDLFGGRLWRPVTVCEALDWTLEDLEAHIWRGTLADVMWATERPATTVTSAGRIPSPGYRRHNERQFGPGTIKVSPAEAGVLQSFRRDYPWQGGTTSANLQVGNAVPPLLAAAALSAVTGLPWPPPGMFE